MEKKKIINRRKNNVLLIFLSVFLILCLFNLATFLGIKKLLSLSQTYFVLLQNNYELRPAGGFMGSYTKVKIKNFRLYDFQVQDIYAPDGQLQGHVDPPWPIEQAFLQGWWRLRDSNWEPDFPTAAEQISWFFQKGGEEKPDGLIALNFLVIKDVIKIFEPIKVPDYNLEINAENFYQITQQQVEKDFFPGSAQKTNFLSSLTKQLILKIKRAGPNQLLQLIKVIFSNLREKQILVFFNNEIPAGFQPDGIPTRLTPGGTIQQLITMLNFSGELKRKYSDSKRYIADYLYIVDTNLGANKANLYVQRKVDQEVNLSNNVLKNKIMINYINKSSENRPNRQDFWGGNYKNFLRVLLPLEAENIKIKINGQEFIGRTEIKEYQDKKIKSVGFFMEVPPQSQTTVEIIYGKTCRVNLTKNTSEVAAGLLRGGGIKYILEIQKQPGIESYPHTIKFLPKNKVIELNIKTDMLIKTKLLYLFR